MVLNVSSKRLLLKWGFTKEDFNQIEEATRKTTYEYDGKRISAPEAIRLLGREQYLSGIARSAFHYTAVRCTTDGKPVIFDSSKLFKQNEAGRECA